MRPRLFVCLGLALVAVSASVMVSQRVLAQAGQPPQGQRSQDDQNRQRGQFSEEIDKALQSYEERMDRNLEQCRKELDQMKKELHELIDMRINMAMSLYELRAKMHVHGQGAMAGGPGAAFCLSRLRRRRSWRPRTGLAGERQQARPFLASWLASSSSSIISFAPRWTSNKARLRSLLPSFVP